LSFYLNIFTDIAFSLRVWYTLDKIYFCPQADNGNNNGGNVLVVRIRAAGIGLKYLVLYYYRVIALI
jgi:hypothetical protein